MSKGTAVCSPSSFVSFVHDVFAHLGHTESMRALASVIFSIVLAIAWLAPVVLTKLFADTLDLLPYFTCLLTGLGAAIVGGVLLWPLVVRPSLTQARDHHAFALMITTALAFAPTWSIGIGLGLNRALDRSPTGAHECRVIAWKTPPKTRSYCVVTSWRRNDIEKLDGALLLSKQEDGSIEAAGDDQTARPFPSSCTPGATLIVHTRAGFFGWPWITSVEKDARAASACTLPACW